MFHNFRVSVTTHGIKVNLHSIHFSSVFLRFCFSVNKYVLFHPHFCMSISALTKLSHTGQKLSERIFRKGIQPYFEISLLSFIPEVESSRTSLASRTHFEVLGLEASSPRKLACPRLEDSSIF